MEHGDPGTRRMLASVWLAALIFTFLCGYVNQGRARINHVSRETWQCEFYLSGGSSACTFSFTEEQWMNGAEERSRLICKIWGTGSRAGSTVLHVCVAISRILTSSFRHWLSATPQVEPLKPQGMSLLTGLNEAAR